MANWLNEMTETTRSTNVVPNFTWRIPSITDAEKKLLCDGYIRNEYEMIVPKSIILICAAFFSPNDPMTPDDIKNANNGDSFTTEPFEMHSLQWTLQLYPNGMNVHNTGSADLFINLVEFPASTSEILLKYELKLHETNTK